MSQYTNKKKIINFGDLRRKKIIKQYKKAHNTEFNPFHLMSEEYQRETIKAMLEEDTDEEDTPKD